MYKDLVCKISGVEVHAGEMNLNEGIILWIGEDGGRRFYGKSADVIRAICEKCNIPILVPAAK